MGEIILISVAPNEETKKELVLDNHKPNLSAKCFKASIKPGTWNIPEHPGT